MLRLDGIKTLTQQEEFAARETRHSTALNAKSAEIQGLVSRVINLEAKIKIKEKENEVLDVTCRER